MRGNRFCKKNLTICHILKNDIVYICFSKKPDSAKISNGEADSRKVEANNFLKHQSKFMRFFTGLLACALLMGACSEVAFEPAAGDSDLTRGGKGNTIGFNKVVLVDGELVPATEGQFSFELWGDKKNGKGEPECLETYTTDADGGVWVDFTEFKGQGRDYYYFREVFASDEEAAMWVSLDDLQFTMHASRGTQWVKYGDFDFNEGPTIVNIPVVVAEPELGPEHESVTLTNAAGGVHPNHNHFCYAELTREELIAGVVLDMVEGNGREKVGEAFVQLNEDGRIVVTFDGVSPEIKGFARTELITNDKNPNSAHNITNINEPIDCPAEGDVIYLFVHLDPVQFYL